MAVYFSGSSRAEASPVRDLVQGDELFVMEFVCDAASDIADLPGIGRCRGGSTAFVISTGQVFMLGENGWTEI